MTFASLLVMAVLQAGGPDGLPVSLSEFFGKDAAHATSAQEKEKEEAEASERSESTDSGFSLGPVAGFVKARGADDGVWFGGVQARFRFLRWLGIEGSITFHRNEFSDGDIEVITYPVQLSGLFFLFPSLPIEPYLVAGIGWYHTRVEFDSSLGGGDETEKDTGVHLGGGLNLELGSSFALFADFRWIFIDDPELDNNLFDENDFDSGQVTLGGSFGF